ncbi:MAG TPA: class I adenylate-forming enzyme family protein [Gammaproteobacteria bacterium]|nr:class I adenylate-forming enzyme family protein [Gammaproteobacteria bacterium]
MNTKIRSLLVDLSKLASYQPDKIALLDVDGRTITYLGLLKQIEQAQAWLTSIGLQPGDTLIALMPNAIETIILFIASLRGSFTYAPLPCTATLSEVRQWKELTRAQYCILANSVSANFQELIIKLDWQVKIVEMGNKSVSWPLSDSVQSTSGGRLIIASSGSTGEPKAMLLDADRLWSAGHAFLRYHHIENSDIRFWNYLPISYLGGLFNLTLIPLAAGGSIFIDESFSGKTFLVFWSIVERFKINSLWLVPTILRGLLALSNRVGQMISRSNIDFCFLGTAPVSLEEKQQFSQIFDVQILENYGLSETTFISSEQHQQIALRRQSTVGAIMPDVEIKFVPIINKDISVTEIFIRTPYMMLGYIDKNGMIEPSVDMQGYLATGDCGQIINGQLQLSGRRRDIIKKGGILVSLREIELVVASYPNIAEAIAVRVEHSFYGESCILYVRSLNPVSNIKEFIANLGKWLHEQLVRHKWPENIVYCDEFPRTTSGKVKKHLLSVRSESHA